MSALADLVAAVPAKPFVGREAAVATLRVESSPASFVLGEAGVGKTRLLSEVRSTDPEVFFAGCIPGAGTVPLDPLVALAKSAHRCGLVPDSRLSALCDADKDAKLPRLLDLFESALSRRSMTMQIDDLHFGDRQTLEAVRFCIERLKRLPVRWQLAARIGYRSDGLAELLRRSDLASIIELEPLGYADFTTLARFLSSSSWLDEQPLWAAYEATGGNPLLLEVVLAAGSGRTAGMPVVLRRLIADQLEAFGPDVRAVASCLAVHGEPLGTAAIRSVVRQCETRVNAALDALIGARIVRTDPAGYAFRHRVLREACYAEMHDATRIAFHDRLAAQSEDDEVRAHHLEASGKHLQSAELSNRCGWDYLDRHEPRKAQNAFRRARDNGGEASAAGCEALAGLAATEYASGRWQAGAAAIAAFECIAGSVPARLRSFARGSFAEFAWAGSHDEGLALPLLETAVHEATVHAPELLPRLLCTLAAIYEYLGHTERVVEILDRASPLSACASGRIAIRLDMLRASVDARCNDPREGLANLEAVAQRADLLGFVPEFVQCCIRISDVCDVTGDSARFRAWCARGLEGHASQTSASNVLLLSKLAHCAIELGNYQEAIGLISAALDGAPTAAGTDRCVLLCTAARAHAMSGSLDRAAEALNAAAALNRHRADAVALAFSSGLLHELQGGHAAAFASYRTAAAAESRARRPREPHALRSLAGAVRSASALGDHVEARLARDDLRAECRAGSALAQTLLAEADAYILMGSAEGAAHGRHLAEAAERIGSPFWRAHLRLKIADVYRDRKLFLDVIETYDRLGCGRAADGARRLARSRGLRPGRNAGSSNALSEREASVALLVANGMTNNEIGNLLHIAARTVEYHVGNILSKNGFRSRVEIASRFAAGVLPADVETRKIK